MTTQTAAPGAAINPLIFDLLEWLSAGPRGYAETMEAWRTSCPRLTIWEDAVDLGYVERRGAPPVVALTGDGVRALRDRRGASSCLLPSWEKAIRPLACSP